MFCAEKPCTHEYVRPPIQPIQLSVGNFLDLLSGQQIIDFFCSKEIEDISKKDKNRTKISTSTIEQTKTHREKRAKSWKRHWY